MQSHKNVYSFQINIYMGLSRQLFVQSLVLIVNHNVTILCQLKTYIFHTEECRLVGGRSRMQITLKFLLLEELFSPRID